MCLFVYEVLIPVSCLLLDEVFISWIVRILYIYKKIYMCILDRKLLSDICTVNITNTTPQCVVFLFLFSIVSFDEKKNLIFVKIIFKCFLFSL